MLTLIFKAVFASFIITLASWISQKRPDLAGFIIALPIASLLALSFSHLQHGDTEKSIIFAKSILIAVPISYLFFLPFFIPNASKLGFWFLYVGGLLLLGIGYKLHQFIMGKII